MRYCKLTTQNHKIISFCGSCLEDINTLICKEGYSGPSPLFTNSELVINMDCAEALLSNPSKKIQKNKSMDMAFGITNESSTKIQMLMVELRLNYNNPNNLNREEIEGKVNGTSLILANIPPIYKRYIFIFKTEQLQEAISRLFRMIPKIQTNYVVMDIHQLKDTYF